MIVISVLSLSVQVRATDVTLFTYEIPGLISAENERPFGLGVETLRLLFEQAGYKPSFELHPFARVKGSVAKYPNACGFPVNYSAQREANIDYMMPLTLVQSQFYALTPGERGLEELRDSYVVTLIQHSAQAQLEDMGMNLLMVSNANTAINLLVAGRADYVVLDDTMAHAAQTELQQELYPVRNLMPNATYLVCHKGLRNISQANIEAAFLEILSNGELRKRWSELGSEHLYDEFFGPEGERWKALLKTYRVVITPPSVSLSSQG